MNDHHDSGGNSDKFKEIAQAFKALSDTEKRKTYEQNDEDVLMEGMGIGVYDESDLCDSLFYQTLYEGGSIKGEKMTMGLDMIRPLEVSLEDFYNGRSGKVSILRNKICSNCDGKGTKSGASMDCAGCKGSGLGPSMIYQMSQVCNECKGRGEKIADKDECPECKGRKVVQEQKVLEVIIEKGMQHGQKIKFPRLADEAPNQITGDIVFILRQKEHTTFRRIGDDLFCEHKPSLTESLCGFQCVLTHLDGRKLLIKSSLGEFVDTESYKTINEEGMPIYQKPSSRGHLHIHFKVDFPKYLCHDEKNTVKAILPPSIASEGLDEELENWEETKLHDVEMEEEMRNKKFSQCSIE